MNISGKKVAIFCRAQRGDETELARQQRHLEQYAEDNQLEIISCYLDESIGPLSVQNDIHLHLLQAARRRDFELILVESASIFPDFRYRSIPRLYIYAAAEDELITAGGDDPEALTNIPERIFRAYPYLSNK